jgi:dienelactone hydrolase
MGFGAQIDSVVGKLSRILHVRSTHTDTSHELGPYLGAAVEEFFAPPPGVPHVRHQKPLFTGSRVTETLSWRSDYQPMSENYRHRHETLYAKNLTAYARWMHPKGAHRKSLLLYVHGWLEPGSWVEEATLMPRWYKELEVDVAHVQLPFHGRRSPRGQLFHGEWFWTADLVRSFEAVRQAIMDVRSIMSYFRDIGYQEIGITGLSLGGSLAMLTACLEPLPDYIVPMIAHLELADALEQAPILWRVKTDLERFGLNEERRREIFDQISIGHAPPLLPPDRQLWVAAREDGYLRPELVEQQWERWNKPNILWIKGGHMTFPIALNQIVQRMKSMPKLAGER